MLGLPRGIFKITLMGAFTFRKEERLNKERWIKELFERGSSFHLYPFRILFMPHPDSKWPVTQVLITVSMRNFKKAVDRNALKRRIREGYRLNKQVLNGNQKWLIAYIYNTKEMSPSAFIHSKVLEALARIQQRGNEKN